MIGERNFEEMKNELIKNDDLDFIFDRIPFTIKRSIYLDWLKESDEE